MLATHWTPSFQRLGIYPFFASHCSAMSAAVVMATLGLVSMCLMVVSQGCDMARVTRNLGVHDEDHAAAFGVQAVKLCDPCAGNGSWTAARTSHVGCRDIGEVWEVVEEPVEGELDDVAIVSLDHVRGRRRP